MKIDKVLIEFAKDIGVFEKVIGTFI